MSFDSIPVPPYNEPICWFAIAEDMKRLSIGLRHNEDMKDPLIQIFDHLFHVASVYDLDMNKAWDKWHKKAKTKKYDYSET